VRVVPNPATVAAGGLGFAGTPNKILFVNLPIKCTLRIYTETGDLVKTIQHYGTADHEWDQRTDDNQYVTSGIYILAVTECEGLNGESLDNQFVKFVLVR
jgi:flagellar hook assembly protein FlgD